MHDTGRHGLHVDLAWKLQELVDSQSKPGPGSIFYVPDNLFPLKVQLQLILEQYGFELHGPIEKNLNYTQL